MMHHEENMLNNNSATTPESASAGILYMERIFIGNLDSDITENQLEELFRRYGPIEVKIIRDKNGTSKGYGFVTFSDANVVRTLVDQKTVKFQNRTLNIGIAIRRIRHVSDQVATSAPAIPPYYNSIVHFPTTPLPYHIGSPALAISTPTPATPQFQSWPIIPPHHFQLQS